MSAAEKTFAAILAELAKPFDPAVVEFKPGAVARNEARALALAYVDSREYMRRLDDADPTWSDAYEVLGATTVVCRLTVNGVTRTDLGHKAEVEDNRLTAAAAQAFKRACTKFGLGRYLYGLPQVWVEYDPQRRYFTPAALASLREMLAQPGKLPNPAGGNGYHAEGGNGTGRDKPTPPGGNGHGNAKPKSAKISTAKWLSAAEALAARCPGYKTGNGLPDYYAMSRTAAEQGYPEILDANLAQVIAALEQQAAVTA
jgi:hypothetical protein